MKYTLYGYEWYEIVDTRDKFNNASAPSSAC